jgi:MFS transporter, FHS family, glucose/mannose:H+ symporter
MSSQSAPNATALSGVAYAGMFVFGIVMALLGAVLPVLTARSDLGLEQVGTLFLVMNGAMLAASLALGVAIDRFGIKLPLALGAGLVAGALAVLPGATRWIELLPVVACLGLGGGALNGCTNTLVADLHADPRRKASALNLLGVFFGIGALALPFGLGASIARVGFAGPIWGAAAVCAITGVAAAGVRFPPAKRAQQSVTSGMARLLRRPLILALGALLFLQSGNEFLLGGYFSTFLTRELSVSIERSSLLLAGYWAAIMAARLALSAVLLRVGGAWVIGGGAVAAAIGALVVGTSSSTAMAMAGVVITGLALAGIFPTALALAGSAFREQSGTVFGLLFTCALTGGMTMPWMAGHLAAAAGLRTVFWLAAANFLLIALAGAIAVRLDGTADTPTPA